jgi:glucose/mannose-6-phosphate isomerase
MRKHIEGFIGQLEDAFSIGEKVIFSIPDKKISNVLILGVGGSGIGGAIVAKNSLLEASIPISICNDYNIPEYVNEETLVIACSYSGNT